jgi:hypothetical protein
MRRKCLGRLESNLWKSQKNENNIFGPNTPEPNQSRKYPKKIEQSNIKYLILSICRNFTFIGILSFVLIEMDFL